jgi:hypothetical protein
MSGLIDTRVTWKVKHEELSKCVSRLLMNFIANTFFTKNIFVFFKQLFKSKMKKRLEMTSEKERKLFWDWFWSTTASETHSSRQKFIFLRRRWLTPKYLVPVNLKAPTEKFSVINLNFLWRWGISSCIGSLSSGTLSHDQDWNLYLRIIHEDYLYTRLKSNWFNTIELFRKKIGRSVPFFSEKNVWQISFRLYCEWNLLSISCVTSFARKNNTNSQKNYRIPSKRNNNTLEWALP